MFAMIRRMKDGAGTGEFLSGLSERIIWCRLCLYSERAKPGCIMTAYNKVNGVHAPENFKLLQDVLKKEWGYSGMVTSDW
jgi:beta-glucosidase